jgi:uroporphyrinogen decarboxylase
LVGAWAAGASVLQVFESGAGDLPPPLFEAFSLPYLRAVAAGVRARTPPPAAGGPLLIAFPRAQHAALGLEALVGGALYDAVSLDWGWAPSEAAARAASASAAAGRAAPLALQGNFDPAALFAPRPAIFAAVRDMLAGFGARTPLVANLGHGMLPSHTPAALGDFFQAVALVSERLRAGGGGGAPLGDAELAELEERARAHAEGRGDGGAEVAAALAVAEAADKK